MDVKTIIKRASIYGVGLDDPTSEDFDIYLNHLNMAHYELWDMLSDIDFSGFSTFVDIDLMNNEVAGVMTPRDFAVKSLPYLKKSFFLDIIKNDPFLANVGSPSYWYWINTGSNYKFFVYPTPPGDLSTYISRVFYTPNPVELRIDDRDDDIPYPADLQTLLIDGMIYYALQDDQGFVSSTDTQVYAKRWENKKSIILSRYQNQKISPIKVTSYV